MRSILMAVVALVLLAVSAPAYAQCAGGMCGASSFASPRFGGYFRQYRSAPTYQMPMQAVTTCANGQCSTQYVPAEQFYSVPQYVAAPVYQPAVSEVVSVSPAWSVYPVSQRVRVRWGWSR